MITYNTMIFILGAADPEMSAIENLIHVAGGNFRYALDGNGQRVTPQNAYQAVSISAGWLSEEPVSSVESCILVECGFPGQVPAGICDHHRPGDPGYGLPPAQYWEASSIGQAATMLDIEPTQELRAVAAADHCLAAAYAGQCPGILPEELAEYRIHQLCSASRTSNRGEARTPEQVRASIDAAKLKIAAAPEVTLGWQGASNGLRTRETSRTEKEAATDAAWSLANGGTEAYCAVPVTAKDVRGEVVPDLPEAAIMMGVAYVAGGVSLREGEAPKVVIGGCGEGTLPGTAPVEAFFGWAKAQGYINPYGDPVRGYAGAYIPA